MQNRFGKDERFIPVQYNRTTKSKRNRNYWEHDGWEDFSIDEEVGPGDREGKSEETNAPDVGATSWE